MRPARPGDKSPLIRFTDRVSEVERVEMSAWFRDRAAGIPLFPPESGGQDGISRSLAFQDYEDYLRSPCGGRFGNECCGATTRCAVDAEVRLIEFTTGNIQRRSLRGSMMINWSLFAKAAMTLSITATPESTGPQRTPSVFWWKGAD
jgi:hypothetical protein